MEGERRVAVLGLMAELERIYAELDDELAPVLLGPGVAAAAAPPVTSQSSSAG